MNKDGKSYRKADSGCEEATKFLKKQSICLQNCPFEPCYEAMSSKERAMARKGGMLKEECL